MAICDISEYRNCIKAFEVMRSEHCIGVETKLLNNGGNGEMLTRRIFSVVIR